MDTERWERIGDIFERLLGTPPTQRPTLLDSLCGGDAELKKIVESMLESEDSAQRFEQASAAARKPTDSNLQAQELIDAAFVGTRVGPWAIQRKLGSGGMGVVWLAQRADGQFEQRVALKLIKRGMDSEAVLARFLRERQILARLQHQHIAHLIDGGVTTDGRPYFAMEYVDGVPLMRYCHEHGATLEKRIKLFLDVCSALQFAHEQHVVHRDLKPSNILVTTKGEVKLLDFGIAKLIEGEDGALATLTDMQRERPMTPAYAAPEQIAGGRISEQTDVYALGCVLYELLTGRHTHDFSAAAGAKDILQIVQSTDPVAPSKLKIVAAPVSLRRLRGDLDTIVLTALKRDPARRYASIAAFAADLKSYLDGAPIAARRDSVFYRAYKFSRRHRAGIAATLAVVAIAATAIMIELREREPAPPIAPGSAMAIVDFNNLSQDKENAWLAPALAEMLGTQLAIGGTLHAVPDELVRPARADLAAPMAGGYSKGSLAKLRKRLGTDYVLSGSYLISGSAGDAKVHLDLAMQDARNGELIANVAEAGALSDLPALVGKAGLNLRARTGFAPITTGEEKQVGNAQPPNTEVARRMGNALDALRKSDPARARDELLHAIALAPRYAPAYLQLARAWKKLGYDSKALASAEQAAAHSEGLPLEQRLRIEHELAEQKSDWPRAIELDKQLLANHPQDPELYFELIDDLLNGGSPKDAREALVELRKLQGSWGDPRIELTEVYIADHEYDYKAQVQHADQALELAQARDETSLAANAKYDLARAYFKLGNKNEAEKYARQAIAEYQRIENPSFEADARLTLAIMQSEPAQRPEAREEYQRILSIYQRIDNKTGIALAQRYLAEILRLDGDRDAMQAAAQHALEISREIDDVATEVWSQNTIAQLKMDEGATDEVIDDFRDVLALSERNSIRDQHIDILLSYADSLRLRGQLEEAGKACQQAEDEAHQLDVPYYRMAADYRCASIALDRGDTQGATAGFQSSLAIARQTQNWEGSADAALQLARIERVMGNATHACALQTHAAEDYARIDMVTGQANAQAALAICHDNLEHAFERDAAIELASKYRRRTTFRWQVFAADMALKEMEGASAQAATNLLSFADDAGKRMWIGPALEARLAAWRLLVLSKDSRAQKVREQISASAHARGFAWILGRLDLENEPAY